ncbi:MAG: nitrate reductase associated protein [Cyanobium sp.]
MSPIASRVYAFESDFAGDLRCLPMAVRRKLDLAGVKLKLVHWHGLTREERQRLLAWADDEGSLAAMRTWLLDRSPALPQGPASLLAPAVDEAWQQESTLPESLAASCRQLGLHLRPQGWAGLDELQRFTLVKLSHPGHEHRNLARALQEFGVLARGS